MTVGERIKSIRKDRGLTQKALGELCKIDEANIRKYEFGKANPKLETVQKLAVALGCSADYLIGRTSDPDAHLMTEEELRAIGFISEEEAERREQEQFESDEEAFEIFEGLSSNKKQIIVQIMKWAKKIQEAEKSDAKAQKEKGFANAIKASNMTSGTVITPGRHGIEGKPFNRKNDPNTPQK